METPFRSASRALAAAFFLCVCNVAAQGGTVASEREGAEENPLKEFEERYLEPRGLSPKEPSSNARLEHYERLLEMRRALGVKHRPAQWRPGPVSPTPNQVDANQCAWSSLGPTNINGRITGIAIDPTNTQRIYATTVGGIWRSTTGGRRWERVSDDFLATTFASIAVNPSTPTEIFAGGGDPSIHTGAKGGYGIRRSTSSGDPGTWNNLVSPPETLAKVIYRIIVDPAPPNDVYAATGDGVYIGTRSGANITFVRLDGFSAGTSDIAVDFSKTPRVVYAGVRDGNFKFGPGIWKYDGTAWNERSSGIPTANSHGINLALAPSAPSTLYARVVNTAEHVQGVYKTTTAAEPPAVGNAWTALPGANGLDDACVFGFCYAGYMAGLAVDPANADIVWAPGVSLWSTPDGGTTWKKMQQGPNANMLVTTHADYHAIVFDPNNSKIVYVGSDGGIFRSTDTSLASWNWNELSHGMVVTEYYRSTSQQALANVMAGGTQDNGIVLTYGNRTWYEPLGCDGFDVAFDAANSSGLYYDCNGGFSELANPVPGTPGGQSEIVKLTLPAGVTRSVPIATDDAVAGAALSAGFKQATPSDPKLYRVLKTTDGVKWTDIGPSLAPNTEVTAIAIAPSSGFKTYYVGVMGQLGDVWRTKDGGVKWTNATNGLLYGSRVNALYVDAANDARVLASTPYGVYFTENNGVDWNPINGSGDSKLPKVAITGAVFDPSDPNTVYAVSDVGVFRGTITPAAPPSLPSGAWTPFDEGLPDGLDVNDIWVNRTTKALKISTMGHGAYLRDIRPSIMCPAAQLLVRDNVYDRGITPSLSGVPDPEYPIPDPARPGFYKPDDTAAGSVYWWQSADVRIDVPSTAPPKNQIADADHVEVQTCPIRLSDCRVGTIRDADPKRGSAARVYVNVSNVGLQSASNVRVTALFANSTTNVPPLPPDFWTTTYPANSTACGALDTSTGWQFADSSNPCKVIPVVNPELPEVARFDWNVPMGQATHSCMLVIIESADDPIDASVRAANETNVSTLVPNHRHLALRNLHVIGMQEAPMGGGGAAPAGKPGGMEPMEIGNPSASPGKIELLVSRAGLAKDAELYLILPTLEGVSARGAKRARPRIRPDELRQARDLKLDARAAFQIPADVREALFVIDMPAKAKWVVGWLYRSGKIEGGTSGRWAVLQRTGGQVLGGNTYFLRAPEKLK